MANQVNKPTTGLPVPHISSHTLAERQREGVKLPDVDKPKVGRPKAGTPIVQGFSFEIQRMAKLVSAGRYNVQEAADEMGLEDTPEMRAELRRCLDARMAIPLRKLRIREGNEEVKARAKKRLRGHAEKGKKKLDAAAAVAIRASEEPAKVLAARYGVKVQTIYNVRSGQCFVDAEDRIRALDHAVSVEDRRAVLLEALRQLKARGRMSGKQTMAALAELAGETAGEEED